MLEDKLNEDFKKALKERDAIKISVIRMLKADITNTLIKLKKKSLTDEDILKIIRSSISKHVDSIEQFKKGKRDDLVKKEEAELEVLKSYLPKEADIEQVKEIIQEVIKETGASGKSDFGRVMKAAMEKLKGRADGKTVSTVVNELLGLH